MSTLGRLEMPGWKLRAAKLPSGILQSQESDPQRRWSQVLNSMVIFNFEKTPFYDKRSRVDMDSTMSIFVLHDVKNPEV